MFSCSKVKVSMPTTWRIYCPFLFITTHFCTASADKYACTCIDKRRQAEKCMHIYVCGPIFNFASAEMIIHFHFLGVRTCHVTLFLVITQTVCSLNFLMYLEINNKQKINAYIQTYTHTASWLQWHKTNVKKNYHQFQSFMKQLQT